MIGNFMLRMTQVSGNERHSIEHGIPYDVALERFATTNRLWGSIPEMRALGWSETLRFVVRDMDMKMLGGVGSVAEDREWSCYLVRR